MADLLFETHVKCGKCGTMVHSDENQTLKQAKDTLKTYLEKGYQWIWNQTACPNRACNTHKGKLYGVFDLTNKIYLSGSTIPNPPKGNIDTITT